MKFKKCSVKLIINKYINILNLHGLFKLINKIFPKLFKINNYKLINNFTHLCNYFNFFHYFYSILMLTADWMIVYKHYEIASSFDLKPLCHMTVVASRVNSKTEQRQKGIFSFRFILDSWS